MEAEAEGKGEEAWDQAATTGGLLGEKGPWRPLFASHFSPDSQNLAAVCRDEEDESEEGLWKLAAEERPDVKGKAIRT
ncbi:hypothetical protein NL676_017177 [Syzygium grande]|nr:hypothetical protein NL676_017177 [Syzygium grande]